MRRRLIWEAFRFGPSQLKQSDPRVCDFTLDFVFPLLCH